MHSVCAMNVKDIFSVEKKCKILSVFIGNQILTGGSASMICDITTYWTCLCFTELFEDNVSYAVVSLYMNW